MPLLLFLITTMNKNVTISVIISVYNEEKMVLPAIRHALESLQNSYEKFELILINDGSTDNTGAMLHKMQCIDDRIIVLDNLVNLNLGLSLKRGFAAAKGDIVLYNSIDLPLNCDDIPALIKEMDDAEILVVQRDSYPGATLWRRFISLGNRLFMKSLYPISTRHLWDMNYVQLFKKDTLLKIMPFSSSPTFTPIEMIIRAHRLKLKVGTTTAKYHRRNQGKGAFGKPHDILWTIYEALRFRIRGTH